MGGARPALIGLAICVAALGPGAALAQSPDEPLLTLDQVVEAALRASPQIAQAVGAVENAESSVRVARAQFLPSLSVSTGTSRSSTARLDPITNSITSSGASSYSAGISTSVDLYTGGRRGAEIDRTHSQHRAAEASLVERRFNVVLAAKRAFFDVLRADDMIRVAEARVERAREGLEAAERLAEVGSGTQSDVLRAQLELTNARQALLQAQTQRRTTAYTLGRLVGHDGAVGALADDLGSPEPLALSRDELVAIVIAQSPAVQAAEANSRAADASSRAARAQYWPSISASGGYDMSAQELDFDASRRGWTVRVGLSYPIFNRFQREDAINRAGIQAEVARLELADARRAARVQLEQLLAALELAEQQIAMTEEAVHVAQEDLRVQRERYRLGVSTILDQVTSQAALVQAENDHIAARHNYQIAKAELEALVGREL